MVDISVSIILSSR